jgi:predicted nucleotide-binding protein (sugar kinase/HSP70/actin superfamily)
MSEHVAAPVKTLYIPYMSDHGMVVGAALEANGLPVVAMPPPDDTSLTVGLDLCRGRECLPCFLIVGDVIRHFQGQGFDPTRAALLLPTTGGLCRLGQYAVLLHDLLEEQGFGEV